MRLQFAFIKPFPGGRFEKKSDNFEFNPLKNQRQLLDLR